MSDTRTSTLTLAEVIANMTQSQRNPLAPYTKADIEKELKNPFSLIFIVIAATAQQFYLRQQAELILMRDIAMAVAASQSEGGYRKSYEMPEEGFDEEPKSKSTILEMYDELFDDLDKEWQRTEKELDALSATQDEIESLVQSLDKEDNEIKAKQLVEMKDDMIKQPVFGEVDEFIQRTRRKSVESLFAAHIAEYHNGIWAYAVDQFEAKPENYRARVTPTPKPAPKNLDELTHTFFQQQAALRKKAGLPALAEREQSARTFMRKYADRWMETVLTHKQGQSSRLAQLSEKMQAFSSQAESILHHLDRYNDVQHQQRREDIRRQLHIARGQANIPSPPESFQALPQAASAVYKASQSPAKEQTLDLSIAQGKRR